MNPIKSYKQSKGWDEDTSTWLKTVGVISDILEVLIIAAALTYFVLAFLTPEFPGLFNRFSILFIFLMTVLLFDQFLELKETFRVLFSKASKNGVHTDSSITLRSDHLNFYNGTTMNDLDATEVGTHTLTEYPFGPNSDAHRKMVRKGRMIHLG